MFSFNNQPLALQSSKTPLVLQNPLSQLVTCLSYIDGEEDDYIREQALNMIQMEKRNMIKKDYLEGLPLPDLKILETPLIKEELERIRSNRRNPEVDMSRYELKDGPPAEKRKDPKSWKESIDHAHTLIQHNNLKYRRLIIIFI